MNILAQGLSNDGFLGGKLADDKIKEWEAVHETLKKNEALTLKEGDFFFNDNNQYDEQHIKTLNELVNKQYKTLPELLKATKDIMKILKNKSKQQDYVKSGLKESNGYKKIQVLLGVNKSLNDDNIGKADEGPWAKLISGLLGPIQVGENKIQRTQYFNDIIEKAEADIMVFVEDDIMHEVISDNSNYTNIFKSDSINGTGAALGGDAATDASGAAAATDTNTAADAAKAVTAHIEKANKYETDTRQSVELNSINDTYELKNIEHGQAARAYKTNSNAVVAKGKILGNYHDGTSIYWKKDTITPNKISIFTISYEPAANKTPSKLAKPEKKSGGVIGFFEFNNNDKQQKFPNGFIVVATHLSSGHAKENDRLNEWKNVNKAIEQFKRDLKDDIPVILSMDANSDPNYGNNVNEGGHPEDKREIPQNLFETVNEDKFNKFYWGNVDPKTLYSVNKIRGLGSDQPDKVGEHEIQLIDWISVLGDGFIINEVKDKDHIGTQNKKGLDKFDNNSIVQSDNGTVTDEEKKIYDAMATENETELMPNANVKSDHLPIIVEISPILIPNWVETITKSFEHKQTRAKLAIANALYKLGMLNEESKAEEQ